MKVTTRAVLAPKPVVTTAAFPTVDQSKRIGMVLAKPAAAQEIPPSPPVSDATVTVVDAFSAVPPVLDAMTENVVVARMFVDA